MYYNESGGFLVSQRATLKTWIVFTTILIVIFAGAILLIQQFKSETGIGRLQSERDVTAHSPDLINAILLSDLDRVKSTIAGGAAAVNTPDRSGETPLHQAVGIDNPAIVQALKLLPAHFDPLRS